uniref:Uncharacterized protein n=1 Tax=Spongospora subterranea TaxID=70186 RepID=A0A0H5QMN5_9EUKA|eukprot:CRZ03415.1 hypothetical protein [Spongospora subterranea]
MGLLSLASFSINDRRVVIWVLSDTQTDRLFLSLTDGSTVWSSYIAKASIGDKQTTEAVFKSLKSQDDVSFQYRVIPTDDNLQLLISRIITTDAGPIKQGILEALLVVEPDGAHSIRAGFQSCCEKIEAQRVQLPFDSFILELLFNTSQADRIRLHNSNQRITQELDDLRQHHDKACEAKLASEEQLICRIADIQADMEKNLLENREEIAKHISSTTEHNVPNEPIALKAHIDRISNSHDNVSSNIEAALRHATQESVPAYQANGTRKRRTCNRSTSNVAKNLSKSGTTSVENNVDVQQDDKRPKPSDEDLFAQLE